MFNSHLQNKFKCQRLRCRPSGSTTVLLGASATALPPNHFKFDFCGNERGGKRKYEKNQRCAIKRTIITKIN